MPEKYHGSSEEGLKPKKKLSKKRAVLLASGAIGTLAGLGLLEHGREDNQESKVANKPTVSAVDNRKMLNKPDMSEVKTPVENRLNEEMLAVLVALRRGQKKKMKKI